MNVPLDVGNAAADLSQFWCTEVGIDWSLIPRSKQDMLELAATIMAETSHLSAELEPSEAYFFSARDKADGRVAGR